MTDEYSKPADVVALDGPYVAEMTHGLEIANGHRCTLIELNSGRCHFPLWGPEAKSGLYCGEPAEAESSWCRRHADRVFVSTGAERAARAARP
jgi:hypothetical protein